MVEVQGRSLAPALVQLTQVPGHRSAEDNELANQLARVGSERPFAGPEPACSFSAGVAKRGVTDWKNRDHKILGVHKRAQICKWFPTRTLCQKNLGITGTRNQLWWVIGYLQDTVA
jgi:hypothetical protein